VPAGFHRRHAECKKELVGLIDGVRESAQSWKVLLLDLKRRGLAIGLGFWQAIDEVWPQDTARHDLALKEAKSAGAGTARQVRAFSRATAAATV
jgi:hypothetical protein